MEEQAKFENFKPKWQKRFEFFDKYGTNIFSSDFKREVNKLSLLEKANIKLNFFGFIFGIFYFLALGIWRKALTLLVLMFLFYLLSEIVMTSMDTSEDVLNTFYKTTGWAWAGVTMIIANKAYYLHKIKGSRSWNPFE